MVRFQTRLRFVVWSLVVALLLQCVVVWRALHALERKSRDRAVEVEHRLVGAYAAACSNAVLTLSSVRVSSPSQDEKPVDADFSAPRVFVLGRGTNGLYDYVDLSVIDENGIESVRRCYAPARNRDSRSVAERRPPGY